MQTLYFCTEESSPLESEDEDVGVTESQDDSENVVQRSSSVHQSNNTRSKADLVSMYHQFFQEINCTKVRFTCLNLSVFRHKSNSLVIYENFLYLAITLRCWMVSEAH